MKQKEKYQEDIETILSHRYDQGFDYFTTPDKRLIKGAPFSAMESALFLLEIGMDPSNEVLTGITNLFFEAWKENGQFKLYPKGGIYPCQTILAVNTLCYLGYVDDDRVKQTFEHLLSIQYEDGGWRCNKFYFGRGPETECSNPFPTLIALDSFRFQEGFNNLQVLDKAVDFLLAHWTIKKPLGPCHYGMGKRFMQVEYPFRNYNIFLYVYILSFYDRAKQDSRFLEALTYLESTLQDGKIVVERVVPKLAKMNFCKKGEPSELATKRYQEILDNLKKG
ncbi:hypothetical protein M2475_001885 [Breznakia sp. PF5-3]|uniref:prenyltransferase n=1 Tax=unclassified Breznakia TaxID=2623764 RepID=UPI002404B7E9|nr:MULTISPECIES: prenyltransferase [unclassified Breznakia]MDF9825429.1 hypothetical protein [Breznakia sp. PM6-1]MDF9836307.1 hypothetical protein [Breznakia sp. PF5-3]MDF9838991.1 hypothetical protein [Breznakia sp. PFB2-8]MDF9861004.1 hypothetical protein [Breznakia sp. PH5-24]